MLADDQGLALAIQHIQGFYLVQAIWVCGIPLRKCLYPTHRMYFGRLGHRKTIPRDDEIGILKKHQVPVNPRPVDRHLKDEQKRHLAQIKVK